MAAHFSIHAWKIPWTEEPGRLQAMGSKESACDAGLIPVWGRSPGEGNGNPLHYSCLGNAMDRGAWRATVHGVTTELNLVTKQQQQHHYSGGFLLCKSGSLQPVA